MTLRVDEYDMSKMEQKLKLEIGESSESYHPGVHWNIIRNYHYFKI